MAIKKTTKTLIFGFANERCSSSEIEKIIENESERERERERERESTVFKRRNNLQYFIIFGKYI